MYVTCQRIVLCVQKRFLSEKNMRSTAHKICVFAVFWYNYTCMCRVKHCHIHMGVIYTIIKKTVICRCILLHACMLHVNTSVYACKTDFWAKKICAALRINFAFLLFYGAITRICAGWNTITYTWVLFTTGKKNYQKNTLSASVF